MNTRLQVEHPVTEEVTALDLVKEQIAVAAGEPLSFLDRDMTPRGPRDRVPDQRRGPRHVRALARAASRPSILPAASACALDTAAYQGYLIPPYYDSLIAKLIVCGRDRDEAISRGRRALDFFVIEGDQDHDPASPPHPRRPRLRRRAPLHALHGAVRGERVDRARRAPGEARSAARLRPDRPRGERRRRPGRDRPAASSPSGSARCSCARRRCPTGSCSPPPRRSPRLARASGAAFFVNDRVDVARLCGAGVHLGDEDLPAAEARAILGPDGAHRRIDARSRGGPPRLRGGLGRLRRLRARLRERDEDGPARRGDSRRSPARPRSATGRSSRSAASRSTASTRSGTPAPTPRR